MNYGKKCHFVVSWESSLIVMLLSKIREIDKLFLVIYF